MILFNIAIAIKFVDKLDINYNSEGARKYSLETYKAGVIIRCSTTIKFVDELDRVDSE